MKLADMPEINLVDMTVEEIETAILDCYKNFTGRTPGMADPVRLFLLFEAEVIYRIVNKINYAGRQNLLRTAEGKNLDALAANICTTRIPASAAVTTLSFKLSAKRDTSTLIPRGTRVSPESGVYFAASADLLIPPGETTGDVAATCDQLGDVGNGYQPGEIAKIVDPVAYVESVVNTTKSEGGSAAETDDALRERAFEAPERFSTAGPSGAYEYHTKSANASIDDVCVWSPSPGVVQVCFLLAGGIVPEAEMLSIVEKALSAKDVRPLTDNVEVAAPAVVKYDVDVSYYIDGDADTATTQKNVAAAVQAYVAWQGARLNRDIDPSELVRRVKAVSGTRHVAVNSPTYTPVGRDSNKLSSTQKVEVAQANSVNVKMMGRED